MYLRNRFILVVGLIAAIFATACGRDDGNANSDRAYKPGVRVSTTVTASVVLMNAEDFDLATVEALVKDSKVADAAELEARINDSSTGINNVDLDKDDVVDYVGVKETQNPDGTYTMDLVAKPVTPVIGESEIVVATLTIDQTAQSVAAAYPNYVGGYDTHYYYHDHLSFSDVMFLSWAVSPRPAYYYSYPVGYASYRTVPVSTLTTTRTSYTKTAGVTTVSPTTRPATYNQSASAQKTSSTVKAKAVTTSGSSTYSTTSTAAQKKPASSGWGKSTTPSTSTSKPSTNTAKPSTPSKPASRPSSNRSSSSGKRR